MPRALGALAGEEEGELAAPWRLALWSVRRGLAVGEGVEGGEQLLAVRAQDHRAVLEGGAGGGEGVGDVGGVELGVRLCRWAARRSAACAQGGLGFGRERRRGSGRRRGCGLASASSHARAGLGAGASSRITWALVPLIAEGGDAGAARAAVALPRSPPRSAARPPPPPSRPWRRARRRAGSSAARPARIAITILITPGDSGRRLGVADVGLDRAEPQRPLSLSWP